MLEHVGEDSPLVSPAQSRMAATHRPSAPSLRQASEDDPLMVAQEQAPAYRALFENSLICIRHRVRRAEDLDVIQGNSNMTTSVLTRASTCSGCCCLIKFFTVSAGCVRKGYHQSGKYLFFGPGVHVHRTPYISVLEEDVSLTEGTIINGTKAILTVTQGFVGLAMDRGQPVLLPPGLHQWDSPTMEFRELIDLSSSIIRMGPYTLVTVDEGYAAVTQDNGEQKILEGGQSYMLTHRNWKFEKFMTKKMQTADVGPIQVTTGDNVPLEVAATVNWLVEDARLAARMAADTMGGDAKALVAPDFAPSQQYPMAAAAPTAQARPAGRRAMPGFGPGSMPGFGPGSGMPPAPSPPSALPPPFITGAQTGTEFDIGKIRKDVVRQITASTAAFIGAVSYSGHGHAEMAARAEGDRKREEGQQPAAEEPKGRGVLFDRERLDQVVEHANEICQKYGVRILSINLISATPADRRLLQALSQGAVAAVAAERTETAARGEAQATLLRARAEADAARIRAEGEAEAETLLAQGSIKAARHLEESEVAVALAKMKQAGACLADGKANSFFFGLQSAAEIPEGMLGNAVLAEAAAKRE